MLTFNLRYPKRWTKMMTTISKETYYELLKNESSSKGIKNALIGDKTVQIRISRKAYVNYYSISCMFKASGANYNELLSHDKAIKYIITHRGYGLWGE